MKVNQDTVLVGDKVVLVPYRQEHVPKYHEWMLDEELRALTASEPLTLEEEYEMQEKWQLDEDKLTFIILSRNPEEGSLELPKPPEKVLPTDDRLTKLQMVGDVNIFLHGAIPQTRNRTSEPATSPSSALSTSRPIDEDEDEFHAEVEIMIAEPAFRRKGLAIEALQLMLRYATGQPQAFSTDTASVPASAFGSSPLNIPPESLLTRISDTNLPSIKLFEKLGFEVTKRVEVFQEVEMRFRRPLTT